MARYPAVWEQGSRIVQENLHKVPQGDRHSGNSSARVLEAFVFKLETVENAINSCDVHFLVLGRTDPEELGYVAWGP